MDSLVLTAATSKQAELTLAADRLRHLRRLEARLDLDELPAGWLERPPRPLIVSCRRTRDGGRFEGDDRTRLARLRPLLRRLPPETLIDVEWDSELTGLIREFPGRRFIVSYHDLRSTPADLPERLSEMLRFPAAYYKIVTCVRQWQDLVRSLALLGSARERGIPLAAFGTGDLGPASRLLALRRGTALLYLAAGGPLTEGMLTWEEFRDVYRAGRVRSDSRAYGILGFPVGHSLSPLLHNACFARQGRSDIYLPLPASDLADFQACLPDLGLAGISVTSPHKETARGICRQLSPDAEAIGAVNTLSATAEGWHGDNTDWIGMERSLPASVPATGGQYLVLGAGGAARAVLHALRRRGATCWIWNRGRARRAQLLADFPWVQPWPQALPASIDVIINATSAGDSGAELFSRLGKVAATARLAMDLAYFSPPRSSPEPPGEKTSLTPAERQAVAWTAAKIGEAGAGPDPTPFLRTASRRGLHILDGLPFFIHQALAQQELWLGSGAATVDFETAQDMCRGRLPACAGE